ncbi:MAG: protein-L-isoaspartate O-methyltransferase [Candidatus Dactylopiibacterium carminicum]|uniref:Protein-L-isoaspartate O-methyltransferase n=1 Tax=Candidatus Dactylopiibacterium carminicum TaxID=857335 RepID=A0A272EPC6_9RHOO|nr:protein-L-isoaspartate O-methyltransferase [Candidatus Dactylopiibacterium carminicum]KAF7597946.1 protein-L-isoaspartate O-methyltransferase [Candidatus Dactylopiibacterium carminicum]PAS91520.1 MAG: protein-L-isoaspartate O-methyltransferase [Candidatus Dactylopiibacterium carminicum]PAS93067.1 MAG: protein-L-isoaspartate O-methyltransferase [Candidatus Dactylopiibacterium carminicum]PAS96070.1 MAG: protein-L-isoaspartate O-methyltransferase [Candidatus Dactylopiibacterium carminicum]
MDFTQTRFNMIEQQIRPAGVLDPQALEILALAHRELFVPAHLRTLAHADTELPIGAGQTMLAPRVEGALLQAVGACRGARVLEIGTGSGYMAALLATHAQQVWTVEIEPVLATQARENLATAGVTNVEVLIGDGCLGYAAEAPYDVILASGAVSRLPEAWREQLRPGGRLLAVLGTGTIQRAHRITRSESGEWQDQVLFETHVPVLSLHGQPSTFVF